MTPHNPGPLAGVDCISRIKPRTAIITDETGKRCHWGLDNLEKAPHTNKQFRRKVQTQPLHCYEARPT